MINKARSQTSKIIYNYQRSSLLSFLKIDFRSQGIIYRIRWILFLNPQFFVLIIFKEGNILKVLSILNLFSYLDIKIRTILITNINLFT